MADAILLQLSKEFARPLVVQMIYPTAAAGGDYPQTLFVSLQQAWNKVASTRLKEPQDSDLIIEARFCLGPAILLDYPTIKSQADGSSQSIFQRKHL